MKIFLLGIALFIVISNPALGQDRLSVFLDCNRCDTDYVRREIDFVDYVRDRTLSDVHLLVTRARGGGGDVYTLSFIGRDEFLDLDDTLVYSSSTTDTENEMREGLARQIVLGLVRYLARTDQSTQLSIDYDSDESDSDEGDTDDKWNYWVFRIGSNGFYRGEESTNSFRFSGNANASRVTEDWKIRLSTHGSYRENNFQIDDSTITSTFRNGNVRGMAVNSIAGRWSAGGFTSLGTSSFNNTSVSFTVSPAIEYSIFPYSESSEREFRLTYFLNLRVNNYEEETIFGKTAEVLLHQEFEASLELEQPWGQAAASFEASNYVTDFKETLLDLYNVELGGFVEVRVVRGLSVFGSGSISRVNDQISLPIAEASDEDILLGNVRLPTTFEYDVSLGVSYTFGSIFNNIVNPRFGS